jgi:hypothetical protein
MQRIVESDADLPGLVTLLNSRKKPFTVTIQNGSNAKIRTDRQNRLQWQWFTEISEQMGDRSPTDVRGDCKLRFGVPILRAENEKFRAAYDRLIKPLPFEDKIEMMTVFEWPVTSLMTTKQLSKYLDEVERFYRTMGVVLTDPGAFQ